MSKPKEQVLIDVKKQVINGQVVLVKVYSPTPNTTKYVVR